MKRSNHRGAVRSVTVLGLVLVALLGVGACSPKEQESPEPAGVEAQAPAFDPATEVWDPTALGSVMPGLVGWQSVSSGGGALVALSPDGTATVVWSSSPNEGVVSSAIAIDPAGPRVLCTVSSADSADATVSSLLLLKADASTEELPMPEGYEGVIGAAFAPDGRALVVAYHATMEEFTTQLGTFAGDGSWQQVTLAGQLPEYQFVERIMPVPGTDAIALVLKTPGGTGDRDDEALVLARLEGQVLTAYTAAFRDDALVGAAPLAGVEGVAYPRTPSVVGLPDVADLVRVEWSGGAWTETVLAEGLPLASGIETGIVTAHVPTGEFWVRTSEEGPHGAGSMLGQFDPAEDVLMPTSLDLTGIDWFAWFASDGS